MSAKPSLTEEQTKALYKALSLNSMTPADAIMATHSLIDDLKMDSLDTIEAVMDIESAFKIEVSDEELNRFNTVQDVADHVASLLWQRN